MQSPVKKHLERPRGWKPELVRMNRPFRGISQPWIKAIHRSPSVVQVIEFLTHITLCMLSTQSISICPISTYGPSKIDCISLIVMRFIFFIVFIIIWIQRVIRFIVVDTVIVVVPHRDSGALLPFHPYGRSMLIKQWRYFFLKKNSQRTSRFITFSDSKCKKKKNCVACTKTRHKPMTKRSRVGDVLCTSSSQWGDNQSEAKNGTAQSREWAQRRGGACS